VTEQGFSPAIDEGGAGVFSPLATTGGGCVLAAQASIEQTAHIKSKEIRCKDIGGSSSESWAASARH
jgi:hypothetical protein